MSRRNDLLDAAIRVVGTEGLRALTHRRVDREADVADGSTSNHFRTRDSLIEGIADRLLALDHETINRLRRGRLPTATQELRSTLVAFVDDATGPRRIQTAARYALFTEAAARPALATAVAHGRAELTGLLTAILASAGVLDAELAARALSAFLDGTILHRISVEPGDEPDELGPAVDRMLAVWIPAAE